MVKLGEQGALMRTIAVIGRKGGCGKSVRGFAQAASIAAGSPPVAAALSAALIAS